jgi:hypothetical protein
MKVPMPDIVSNGTIWSHNLALATTDFGLAGEKDFHRGGLWEIYGSQEMESQGDKKIQNGLSVDYISVQTPLLPTRRDPHA